MNRAAELEADSSPPAGVDQDLFLSQDKPEDNCCLPGSWGAELCPEVKDLVSPRDVRIVKSYYSAFTSSSLLLMLRAKLITEVYVVGCTTNLSVYATALDAAQHGLSINLVEDCLNYRLKDRHDRAVQKLVEIMGASVTTSASVLSRLRGETPTDESSNDTGTGQSDVDMEDQAGSQTTQSTLPLSMQNLQALNFQTREIIGVTQTQSLLESDDAMMTRITEPNTQHLSTSLETTSTTEHNRESRKTMEYPTPEESAPVLARPTRVSRKLQMRQKNSTLLSTSDIIGSGDSKIVYNLLEPDDSKVAFQDLFSEVHWQRMYHAAGEVPRLVCCQGEIEATDGSMPVYRHPSDQSLPLLHWSPVVAKIKERAEARVGHTLNHALIQLYRSGQDHISEHSDKTLDIVYGSKIVNVSLGAQRTMRLRTKRPTTMQAPDSNLDKMQSFGKASHATTPIAELQVKQQDDRSRVTQRIPMPHNSMFVMGLETNGSWLHGITPDKRPAVERTPTESAYGNMRISITFRQIGTFLSADSDLIWGQGAVAKEKIEARPTINGNPEESQRLIDAFGFENQGTAPDWNVIYGTGFDVLHIKSELPEHENPMLFLSGDETADAVVIDSLSKFGIDVDIIAPPREQLVSDLVDENGDPLVVTSSQTHTICFRQAGGTHTEIEGEAAILEFLEQQHREGTGP
ncbi:hypothetical protein E4T42_06894 [Aureobasidium subglaciale]|nr:hypothetical protein E4T42_06894 [Aureobasidium subglaciale]